jgi:hypothetical protein
MILPVLRNSWIHRFHSVSDNTYVAQADDNSKKLSVARLRGNKSSQYHTFLKKPI